ncbi:Protein of unknown function DUF503 [Moorella glycerini]|uniref:DUF503 domain-containing protein n=1 Tax=Neomoorella stamsii TaxID=1266720 RepID=A0A9X7J5K0_9FIRM|nr:MULTISPECIES: DUF503 domain-containing protein [Moorella]PRR74802.1 hypothetical protein MOST_09770 [Moorella stamsii]CEP65984.1 Protein of unknown function DUF503 [Moorella glycerini]
MRGMVIGVSTATLRIAGARNLKDKRRVLKSVLTRLHNRFNVAAAEVGRHDSHQEAEVGIACVSTAGSHADQVLAAVMGFLEAEGEIELVDYHTELL